ncbi:hypothetical protein C5167_004007 [Papaver somniferum]|nr:hypothetical protein C5167_004007 [Papaver somniferum]
MATALILIVLLCFVVDGIIGDHHCCTKNPPALNSSSGYGHVEEIGGLKAYVSGSLDSKLGILLVSDFFGYEAPNLRYTEFLHSLLQLVVYGYEITVYEIFLNVFLMNRIILYTKSNHSVALHKRKLADKVAAAGYYVVVPDFFHGDPFTPGEDVLVWLQSHGTGISAVGAAGMCWGEIKVPISILGAELDKQSPPALLRQFEEVLSTKPEVDSFVKIFKGVDHGWTLRYNIGNKVAVKQAAVFLASVSSIVNANDPGSVQDFCVAARNPNSAVFVNGQFCKDPKLAVAEDFFLAAFNKRGVITSPQGSLVKPANVAQIPGLNTLGISMVRIDYAPFGGMNPPHTHPRATEILVVLEGTLDVGFVTSNPENKLIAKTLQKGDVFVFPIGLIHAQVNVGKTPAVAIAALSSQNPGVITIANAVFGSKPFIPTDILAKAFQVDNNIIDHLQAQFPKQA